MATVVDDYPLFYDATNEKGLSMAGLNFPENTDFKPAKDGKTNVASFEFILWILSQCESVSEVRQQCENLNLTDDAFSSDYPVLPLHWMISDSKVEPVKDKVAIKEALFGYLKATTIAAINYVETLTESSLDDIVDNNWTPAVTRVVRLVFIIDDASMHSGQVFYSRRLLGLVD
nr:linear amide C-N hydrolase [Streptococcus gallolyticus]